ncbi:hypothetical protein X907_1020 [Glycocaulis alkaliphilus]|uniref:Uncharacterized protein n=1 Tax=Glycocaulis alkaliphilus TaxID=1434191 RepID=A0A3T0E8B9_9PROT|nr:hypothetical protein [Glycocaulis alkaliphilus]AZU03559.1 hypothetical protein X907_1020 [Glycocaulis alkaliphilus]GGB74444.1 hypothetical protein GCM10007417_12880 [Glycocaulis alkaliphilus]
MELLLLVINIFAGALLLAALVRIAWPYFSGGRKQRRRGTGGGADRDTLHTSAE